MINASKEFKEKLKNGGNVVNYADVTLADGTVLHLEPKDFMQGGCSIEDKTTDGKFGVGFVIGKIANLRIANHDERFSIYNFYGSIINLYVAMLLDDGHIEKIRKGVYYTRVPQTPGDIIEISAVDAMYKLDRDYSESTTVYPATLQKILSDACIDCGIPVGFGQFDNYNFAVQEKPESTTYRQVVSYVAQVAGYNARIDNNGYMQLVWYKTALLDNFNYDGGGFKHYPQNTIVDGGNFTNYSKGVVIDGGTFGAENPEHIFRIKSIDVHTDDVQITGVRVAGEEDKYSLFGEEGYLIDIIENPFVYGKEKQVADYLGSRIVGMIFRPFSAETLNNPLYEPFDVVRVSDRKGNTYLSLLNSVSYTIGSFTDIACEAEDPVSNGSSYVSKAAQAVVEARRNAQKQLTDYDKAVQNMNQIAMNAMGFHTTYVEQSDGSRIIYLHDKSTLAESMTIYMQSADGFFLSTDGGKSYSAGFDSQGNVVMNVLSAIGIVADWVKTGSMSANRINGGVLMLGGANNENGEIYILNAQNQIIGKWNKDGLKAIGDIELEKVVNAWQGGVTKNRTYRFLIGEFSFLDPTLETYHTIAGLKTSVDGVDGLAIAEIQNSSAIVPAGNRPISIFAPLDEKTGNRLELLMTSDWTGGFYLWNEGSGYGVLRFGVDQSTGKPQVDMSDSNKVKFRGDNGYGIYVYAQNQSSSGQNAIFVNEGSSEYRLYRGTSSSRRYKHSIRSMKTEDIEGLYNIQPVFAVFNNDILSDTDERYGVSHPMFIAEDVDEYFPEAVDHNPDGSAENWNQRVMIPAMFQMIKSQKETINSLEKRIERLESMIER